MAARRIALRATGSLLEAEHERHLHQLPNPISLEQGRREAIAGEHCAHGLRELPMIAAKNLERAHDREAVGADDELHEDLALGLRFAERRGVGGKVPRSLPFLGMDKDGPSPRDQCYGAIRSFAAKSYNVTRRRR